MLEIARFEWGRRVRGTALLSVALLALVALTIGLFPSIRETGAELDAYLETLPPEVARAFVGDVTTLTTIEGYLVSQLYQFAWVILLGIYFAYAAGSTVAGEVERGRADMLLSLPITRARFVVEKFLAFVPAIVALNAVTFAGIYAGIVLVDESIDLADIVAVHGVSVLYLLACAGVGLLASVSFDSIRRAQVVGAGVVFGTFLLDSITYDTDYEWIGALSVSRYFDPAEILVAGDLEWTGVLVLAAVTVGLVAASAIVFERKDIE
ncbi:MULTISPECIES: ABC transporter permease [Natrialbaceae]|uniref:ABC transporter permease n=1 Tax=Natrialbaceae TaxID=1644061 RepID=UPI00207C3406|nr:ABC transporter permease [Natronococcus sp. CG52]